MKKALALVVAVLMAALAVTVASAATFESDVSGTVFDVLTTSNITFSYHASETTEALAPGEACKLVPRGGCTIEALGDGDLVADAAGFSTKGIITIENSTIPLLKNQGQTPVVQADEDIPIYSFSMDFGEEVTFDTAYMALYHEIAACIAIPGEKKVIVETSKDGTTYVPVGEGEYYFNSHVGDYDGEGDQGVDECPVYLGKKVTSRYVRFTYTFLKVMDGGYWHWYTNVHDWAGFTEIGVANYKSGKKPTVFTADDVADPTEVKGSWIGDDGEYVTIYDFTDKTVNIMTFDSAEYQEKGLDAEIKAHDVGLKYSVTGTTLSITYSRKKTEEIQAERDEDGNLILGTGKKAVAYEAYTEPEPAAIRGEWMYEKEEDGKKLLVAAVIDSVHIEETAYDYDEWQEKGFEAEAVSTSSTDILLRGNIVTLLGKEIKDLRAAAGEDGSIQIGDTVYAPKSDPGEPVQPDDSSETLPEDSSDIPSEEPSKAPSEEPSEAVSEEPSEEPSAQESEESKPAEQNAGGFPWWAWVLIGVGVLAVVGIVLGVVLKKKK